MTVREFEINYWRSPADDVLAEDVTITVQSCDVTLDPGTQRHSITSLPHGMAILYRVGTVSPELRMLAIDLEGDQSGYADIVRQYESLLGSTTTSAMIDVVANEPEPAGCQPVSPHHRLGGVRLRPIDLGGDADGIRGGSAPRAPTTRRSLGGLGLRSEGSRRRSVAHVQPSSAAGPRADPDTPPPPVNLSSHSHHPSSLPAMAGFIVTCTRTLFVIDTLSNKETQL